MSPVNAADSPYHSIAPYWYGENEHTDWWRPSPSLASFHSKTSDQHYKLCLNMQSYEDRGALQDTPMALSNMPSPSTYITAGLRQFSLITDEGKLWYSPTETQQIGIVTILPHSHHSQTTETQRNLRVTMLLLERKIRLARARRSLFVPTARVRNSTLPSPSLDGPRSQLSILWKH